MNSDQREALRRLLKLCNEAVADMSAALESGYMSDTKESAHAIRDTITQPMLAGVVDNELLQLANEIVSCAVKGDNPQQRAGRALTRVLSLRENVLSLLGATH